MITVIIPVFNEETCIHELYSRICNLQLDLSILFVDDGSTDATAQIIDELRKNDTRVDLLSLSRNFGHQIAITAGLDHADGNAVIIMDADLQDPPEVIPQLINEWRQGADVVYAVRSSRDDPWTKRILAKVFYKLLKLAAKINIPEDVGDFRLVDSAVVSALRSIREVHRYMRGLVCWVGFKHVPIYYERPTRYAGTTKYPLWKSAVLAINALTSFSASLLRWLGAIGIIVCLVLEQWASAILATILLVIALYVGLIYEEVKSRPLYFIRSPRV